MTLWRKSALWIRLHITKHWIDLNELYRRALMRKCWFYLMILSIDIATDFMHFLFCILKLLICYNFCLKLFLFIDKQFKCYVTICVVSTCHCCCCWNLEINVIFMASVSCLTGKLSFYFFGSSIWQHRLKINFGCVAFVPRIKFGPPLSKLAWKQQ